MALNITGAYKWLKRLLIAGLILLVAGSVVVWYIFTDKFTDTAEREASYTLSAVDLIKEFIKNDSLANSKYSEKIIIVNGTVSEVEAADTTVNIKMTDGATGSYISFGFQKEEQAAAKKIRPGDNISIKGSCSNGIYSSILESESITFKRCVINKK